MILVLCVVGHFFLHKIPMVVVLFQVAGRRRNSDE